MAEMMRTRRSWRWTSTEYRKEQRKGERQMKRTKDRRSRERQSWRTRTRERSYVKGGRSAHPRQSDRSHQPRPLAMSRKRQEEEEEVVVVVVVEKE
jgi:hypothetical protein